MVKKNRQIDLRSIKVGEKYILRVKGRKYLFSRVGSAYFRFLDNEYRYSMVAVSSVSKGVLTPVFELAVWRKQDWQFAITGILDQRYSNLIIKESYPVHLRLIQVVGPNIYGDYSIDTKNGQTIKVSELRYHPDLSDQPFCYKGTPILKIDYFSSSNNVPKVTLDLNLKKGRHRTKAKRVEAKKAEIERRKKQMLNNQKDKGDA